MSDERSSGVSAAQERLRNERQGLVVIAAVVSFIVTAIIIPVIAIVSVVIPIIVSVVIPIIVSVVIPIITTVIVPISLGPCPLIIVSVIIGAAPKLRYRDATVTVVIRGSHQTVRPVATEFSNQFIEGQNTIGVGINGPETGGLSGCGIRGKRGN